ncbi:McrC family protein, partial [Clostridium tertium]|uniref:McrC family protein n=1 Tax=Clostridium tertium TaxID=1559 RepID=UPI00241BF918
MKTKYIVVREAYDWLSVGSSITELTSIEFNSVCNYLKTRNLTNAVRYGFNRIKFINYVGIISVGNLVIEILPKISITNDIVKDRKMLMFMLSKCNKISVNINEAIETSIVSQSLLDILAKIFTKKFLLELQKGLYLEYVTQEDSLNKIKGKVMLTQNAKVNYINKSKVYCRYDEFTENNTFNSILLRTTNLLLSVINNSNVKKELNIIKSILNDVDDIYIPLAMLENYKLNKNNERFKEAFILAKLILNNSTMNKSIGRENGFSILFEMNYLYEE